MITVDEFFRNKIKEQNSNREVVNLSQELITAEEGMRWAHEFKQLYLQDIVVRSEQLVNFLFHLNDRKLINNYDFDYEKEAENYLKKTQNYQFKIK